MDKIKNYKFLKYGLLLISICFAIPSIIYILKNKTILYFSGNLEYCFLLTNNIDRLYQSGIFAILILLFIILYYLIIKNRNRIFKNTKQIFKFILTISLIFILVIPFFSSDVFYYLGIGRLSGKYHQNPYYTDMKSYMDNNNINIQNDTVMQKGYSNYWAETTVVYGALWTFICTIISYLSFGNINFGILIFKLVNVFIHLGNCYLLYKISKRKLFPLLYGLNPFILIEGIANVHNDIFVIFFMLLSLFMLLNEQKIVPSILFLAMATDIKYFSILLLPLIIIYHYRDRDIKERIIKCIQMGLVFLVFVAIPYLLYFKDVNVFSGLTEQNNKIAKGLYLFISEYFSNPSNLVDIIKNFSLFTFALLYITKCISLLSNKNIQFYKEMRELFWFMVAFIFLLITNFQPWYLIWLTPFMLWQKRENIILIIQMQIMTLIANIVFLIYSENYKYGVPFFTILVFGILICIINNRKKCIVIRK